MVCACDTLGISDVDGPIIYPRGLFNNDDLKKKREFVEEITQKVVDKLTLVDSAFTVSGEITYSGDTCYNYARVLCHYGSLVMEFRDAWAEGDCKKVLRCWKFLFTACSGSWPY